MTIVLLIACLWVTVDSQAKEKVKMPIPESTAPPGVVYSPELRQKLHAALAAKGADYRPRTRNLWTNGAPKYTNRLILEDSPYLLQHAHNPVDWHSWGQAAFDQAQKENKPVFLSIGYSTCHWCHVMEEESFDNPEIAEILNRYFIPIKIDRERRPDVDTTYMNAVMLVTGQGGWPLSAFLTPQGKLFFGATYFPPGQFRQLLLRVAEAWKKQRADLEAQADEVARAVARMNTTGQDGEAVNAVLAERAVEEIMARFDSRHGGFGEAPKFPNEPWLLLLLDETWRQDRPKVWQVLDKTLDAMARGGIYDQIGGGFHRYATDAAWQIPHFEKMLYNQAQLGLIYTQAARLMNNRFFASIARQTFDYVLTEMTSPDGGFYSATDADSEGEEGRFFVWTPSQIQAALPADEAALAIEVFGVTDQGNFEGNNILHLGQPLDAIARGHGMSVEALAAQLKIIRDKLYRARAKRQPPLRDDKVVTAWNGMMILSLAEAGQEFSEPRYLQAAQRAAQFLWRSHRRGNELLRASLNGRASGDGMQEDYAWLALAFLALYDGGQGEQWLSRCQALTEALLTNFWDDQQGGFYMNRQVTEPLMVRPKDHYDGAQPSGNSVAARLLARLLRRAPQLLYETRFHQLRSALAGQIRQSPAGLAYFLLAVREYELGETGPLQYAAQGHVKVRARQIDARLQVEIEIQPGWHINGSHPEDPDLIPTALSVAQPDRGWRLEKLKFPQPSSKALGFRERSIPVYEGRVEVTAKLTRGQGPLPLKVKLQACDQSHCLAPETLLLQVAGDAGH